jgi:tetratricopeptide (TPR) repeat protein
MPIKIFSSTKPQTPEVGGKYWLALAQEHLANEKYPDALNALQQAEALLPFDPQVYRLQALALNADGQETEALAAGMAVTALEENSAIALFNIGTAYFMNRHWQPAAKWYRRALVLDADLVSANQNLAAILYMEGHWAEADKHYERAYRIQSLFIDQAEVPIRNILILCSARPGNVPFEHLLPETRNTRIKWIIEYSPEQVLPSYDIVFNAIGDADVAVCSRAIVDSFLAGIDRPLLNPPQCVALTTRDHIGALLEDIEGIRVPAVARWDRLQAETTNDVHARIAAASLTYPVIVRPIGGHGGDGVVLLQSQQDETPVPYADGAYLTSYRDYKSADGYYRKYRVIFVDRKPYPYHLAISSNWLVHYDTADMLNPAWKIREEAWFLSDPIGVLGQAAWTALEAIAQRLDLDYAGIDFSVLPDRQLLIFETNATMLVHPETYHEALKFKNHYVLNILDAFDRMLDQRIGLGELPEAL